MRRRRKRKKKKQEEEFRPTEPRSDMKRKAAELGSCRELDYHLLHLPTAVFRTLVYVTLLKEQVAEYRSCFTLSGSPAPP